MSREKILPKAQTLTTECGLSKKTTDGQDEMTIFNKLDGPQEYCRGCTFFYHRVIEEFKLQDTIRNRKCKLKPAPVGVRMC